LEVLSVGEEVDLEDWVDAEVIEEDMVATEKGEALEAHHQSVLRRENVRKASKQKDLLNVGVAGGMDATVEEGILIRMQSVQEVIESRHHMEDVDPEVAEDEGPVEVGEEIQGVHRRLVGQEAST